MNMTLNFHNIVRARVETTKGTTYTWQTLTLEISKTGSGRDPNPETEKQDVTFFPHSHSFHPTLPNTEDVDEAVKHLRRYVGDLREMGEDEEANKVEALVSRLGYSIHPPGSLLE